METAGRRDEIGFHSEHLRVCVELRNSYPATVQSWRVYEQARKLSCY